MNDVAWTQEEKDQLYGDSRWRHDKAPREAPDKACVGPRYHSGWKLEISNLHHEVNNDDIKELFGAHGDLIKYKVLFDDRSGRSRGEAFVIYATEEEAESALRQYNQVALDGKEMQIRKVSPKKLDTISMGKTTSGLRITSRGYDPEDVEPSMTAGVRGRGNVGGLVSEQPRQSAHGRLTKRLTSRAVCYDDIMEE